MTDEPIPLTGLYVPGDRPDRFDRALASGADLIVLDLEDGVAAPAKQRARDAVREWLAGPRARPVQVRINGVRTPEAAADLAALRGLIGLAGIRLPKAESAADIDDVLRLGAPRLPVHAVVETARGIEAVAAIAGHPGVRTIGLGEADLAADLGASGEDALDWVRGRLVVAARAAGLPAPLMSVYPNVADLEGLAASCANGRALGFRGRLAIHPRQLPVIVDAFRPTPAEVAGARAVVAAMAEATSAGLGVAVLPSGAMLDAAMLPAAQRILALAAAAAAADRALPRPAQEASRL